MFFKNIILIEKLAVLVTYSIAACYVLCRVRCALNLPAYVTIIAFLICLSISSITYLSKLYNLFEVGNDQLIYELPLISSQGILMGVLYYYTFEIRVVLLKVSSESHIEYQKRLIVSKVLLWIGVIGIAISYGLEIYEKIEIDKGNQNTIEA